MQLAGGRLRVVDVEIVLTRQLPVQLPQLITELAEGKLRPALLPVALKEKSG